MKTFDEIGRELGVSAAAAQMTAVRAMRKLSRSFRAKELWSVSSDITERTKVRASKAEIKSHEKLCAACGKLFLAFHGNAMCCSTDCKRKRKAHTDSLNHLRKYVGKR